MATEHVDFSAAVDAWVAKSKKRLTAVFRESTQRTVSIMQVPVGSGGNMPVDTGFLRASIRASLNEMPSIDPGARPPDKAAPGSVTYDPSNIFLTIARAEIGETIHVGYTASYAQFQENRRGFVRLAAAQWQATVRAVVHDVKARSGAA